MNKKDEEHIGRPTVMTPETIKKLEEVFVIGGTDVEACLWANIASSTLYDYCKGNPTFSERKEDLKQHPKLQARFNVVKEIEKKDVTVSQWYLERKGKDEFSGRKEITGADGQPTEISITYHNGRDIEKGNKGDEDTGKESSSK